MLLEAPETGTGLTRLLKQGIEPAGLGVELVEEQTFANAVGGDDQQGWVEGGDKRFQQGIRVGQCFTPARCDGLERLQSFGPSP